MHFQVTNLTIVLGKWPLPLATPACNCNQIGSSQVIVFKYVALFPLILKHIFGYNVVVYFKGIWTKRASNYAFSGHKILNLCGQRGYPLATPAYSHITSSQWIGISKMLLSSDLKANFFYNFVLNFKDI